MALSDIPLLDLLYLKRVNPLPLIARVGTYVKNKSSAIVRSYGGSGIVRGSTGIAEAPLDRPEDVLEFTALKPSFGYNKPDYLQFEKFVNRNYGHMPDNVRGEMLETIQLRLGEGANPKKLIEILSLQIDSRKERSVDLGERK